MSAVEAIDIGGVMRELGRKARAAASVLAFASTEAKDAALIAAADAIDRAARGDPRGQRGRHGGRRRAGG